MDINNFLETGLRKLCVQYGLIGKTWGSELQSAESIKQDLLMLF